MNWFRVAFYVTLAATGFAPIFQLSWTRSSQWAWMFYAPIGKSITVYLVGAVIYAGKVSPFILVAWRVSTKRHPGTRKMASRLVRLCRRKPQHLASGSSRRHFVSLSRDAELLLSGLRKGSSGVWSWDTVAVKAMKIRGQSPYQALTGNCSHCSYHFMV